jgi:nitrogen PTS system EIIA component
MDFEQALGTDCVMLDLPVADKAEALSRAAALLAQTAGTTAAKVERALLERESLGSTGVGAGVGIPHARMHGLARTCAVFLRLSEPIEFEAIDGKPVDLVCALIAPDEPSSEMLLAVSAVARSFRDPDCPNALRKATDAAAARRVLVAA